jgi:phosphonate transport system substrate-binding protein
MKRRHVFPALLGSWAAWPSASLAQANRAGAPPTYTFGVVPQQSATELARIWIPVISLLSERSQLSLRFATAPDIPTFEKRMAAGAYDFAYMNPYHYTVFKQKPGYEAFAKEKGRTLKGIVVVRKDSEVKDIAGLASRDIAFPAPASFAATVLVRAEFERRRMLYTPKFVNSHESVYLNVARGLMPAGGGIPRTLQTMDAEVRDQLRVLWSTAEFTPHAFATHPRVAAEVVSKVRDNMARLDNDARGRSALEGVGFRGIEAARDAQWNDIRALGLDTLAALLKG